LTITPGVIDRNRLACEGIIGEGANAEPDWE
jgi:hypothetical protein